MERWRKYGQQLRSTVSYSTIGIEMGLAVGVGYLIGDYLDGRFDSAPYGLIGCVLMGSIAGFLNLYRMLKRLSGRENE